MSYLANVADQDESGWSGCKVKNWNEIKHSQNTYQLTKVGLLS